MIDDGLVCFTEAQSNGTEIRTTQIHAIGINIEEKTSSQWSSETRFNKAMFDGKLDNAAMKKLLDTSPRASLLFQVVILTDQLYTDVLAIY